MLYCASFEKGHFRGVYDLKMDFENCAQYNIILLFTDAHFNKFRSAS